MFSEVFAYENLFLIIAAIIWIIIASIQDIRRLEVANWWSFSLIILALAYRAFLSIAKLDFWYFLWGLIGLSAGFIFANLFYYSRMFAGGDAKLMLGISAVLPLSLNWAINLKIFALFLIFILFTGGFYGLIYSFFLAISYKSAFRKSFIQKFKKYSCITLIIAIASLLFLAISFFSRLWLIFWLSVLMFLSPFLLIYAKSIEESCMIKKVKAGELTVGDWIAKTIYVGKEKIEPDWQGLNEKDLKLIQSKYNKKVLIKRGIPFIPTFLFAFIGVLLIFWLNLSIIFF